MSVQPANAAQNQSQIENPQPAITPSSPPSLLPSSEIPEIDDVFLGSVVINPHECNAAVVLKTLEQETAHRARQLASAKRG